MEGNKFGLTNITFCVLWAVTHPAAGSSPVEFKRRDLLSPIAIKPKTKGDRVDGCSRKLSA